MKCLIIRLIQLLLLLQNCFNFFWFRRKFSNIELCIKADENRINLSLVWHLSLSGFRALKQTKTKTWLIICTDVKKAVKSKLLKSSSNLFVWKLFLFFCKYKTKQGSRLAEWGRSEMTKDIQYVIGEVGGNRRKHLYCLKTTVFCQSLT